MALALPRPWPSMAASLPRLTSMAVAGKWSASAFPLPTQVRRLTLTIDEFEGDGMEISVPSLTELPFSPTPKGNNLYPSTLLALRATIAASVTSLTHLKLRLESDGDDVERALAWLSAVRLPALTKLSVVVCRDSTPRNFPASVSQPLL